MTILAVDLGRTNCRVGVFTRIAGGELVAGPSLTRASTATIVDPDGPARIAATVRAALAALPSGDAAGGDDPDRNGTRGRAGAGSLVLAAAGRLAAGGPARALATALAATAPPGIGEIVVTSDVVAAHAAAFDGAPGVVLVAGTGAVALALDAAGAHHVVDGAGYLIGDAGGGFAIGRAGLAAALRHEDGRGGGSAALAAAVAQRFASATSVASAPAPDQAATLPDASGPGVRGVVTALHASADPARLIASFAPEVAAAARAGDPVAAGIWREAAAQLADTAVAASRFLPAGAATVVVTGALGQVEDLLVAPLRALVARRGRDIEVRVGGADALRGAAALARRPHAYESLLLSRPVRDSGAAIENHYRESEEDGE